MLHRRQILNAGSLSLLGLSLPKLLAAEGTAAAESAVRAASFGRAKRCILLFMWGGPAHQDTWDMKPDAPAEYRGEFSPVATNVPGIHICEHLPLMARRMDQLCLIRSMTHDNGDHTTGTHYLLTGEPPPPVADIRSQWPPIGSVLAKLKRGNGPLPPFVSMRPELPNDVPRFVEQTQGQFAGWLGPMFDPLTLDQDPSLSDYHIAETELPPEVPQQRMQQRRDLLASLNRLPVTDNETLRAIDDNHRRAFELLTTAVEQRGAFKLEDEPAKLRERYGHNPHGQSVLQARRLIERGVPLVTVFWPNDGIKNVSVYWDTHSRNFVDLKQRLMPVTDQAYSALLDDLSDRGMLDDTLVIWTGEFGRTPRVGQRSSDAGAGADGRDHWPGCFTSILAGAGVPGGTVYGSSDRVAAYPATSPVAPRDLIATAYHLLGVDEQQTIADQRGRPQFIRRGTAIRDIL